MSLRITFLVLGGVLMNAKMSQQICLRGTYMVRHGSGDLTCELCQDGTTFMSDIDHTKTHCYTCSRIQNPQLEIVVRECNVMQDTDIQCIPGYYRRKGSADFCDACSVCKFLSIPCRNFTDTICCSKNDDVVHEADGTYSCREHPVLCGPGQYFNEETDKCLSCPPNTYMTSYRHKHTSCVECNTLSNNLAFHSVIIQPCNSVSPTIFGCSDGYFRDFQSLAFEANCSKCRTCQRESQPCHHIHDAICASDYGTDIRSSHPDVSHQTPTLWTPPQIATDEVTHGEDGHLYSNQADSSAKCTPCKPGTFSDEMKYTKSLCKEIEPILEIIADYLNSVKIFVILTFVLVLCALVVLCAMVVYKNHQLRTRNMDLSFICFNKGGNSQNSLENSSPADTEIIPTPDCDNESQRFFFSPTPQVV